MEGLDADEEYDPTMGHAEFHVTIADTSHDFARLEALMQELAATLPASIDMMGRRYHPERDSLLLPFDDADELYAGSYFPRRFPSGDLSIEYLDNYTTASPGAFALVTGIWETSQQADSALRGLAPMAPSAFTVQAELFLGCMH
ncbi:MAG: hypothetical protein KF797_00230 [Flavobacteriales bacterium]|nr:hypothetical protein [Flavobacteriales bacterium]